VLEGIDSGAHLITVNEQIYQTKAAAFTLPLQFFASESSGDQNLFIFTVAAVKCLCGVRKKVTPYFILILVVYQLFWSGII